MTEFTYTEESYSKYDHTHDEDIDPDNPDGEPGICTNCNGSGEGMYEGTRCRVCKGKGEV